MLRVLLINWLAFLCFAGLVCWSRYRLEILQRELEETQALEALLEPGAHDEFFYAAYAATWIIHIVYLGTLVRRYQRLSKEIAGLKK